tara:strand:+ start:14608 stop:15072 length:465 start_codon:yes stop_codon:yes gene_type:complete
MIYTIKTTARKDGVNKNNEEYTQVLITTEETNDDLLSGFATEESLAWKAGDKVDLGINEREFNGKMYYNYRILTPHTLPNERPSPMTIEARLTKIENFLRNELKGRMEKIANEAGFKVKSDLLLELNGTFQTTADKKESDEFAGFVLNEHLPNK